MRGKSQIIIPLVMLVLMLGLRVADPGILQLGIIVSVPIIVGAMVHIGGGLLLRFPEARRLDPRTRR